MHYLQFRLFCKVAEKHFFDKIVLIFCKVAEKHFFDKIVLILMFSVPFSMVFCKIILNLLDLQSEQILNFLIICWNFVSGMMRVWSTMPAQRPIVDEQNSKFSGTARDANCQNCVKIIEIESKLVFFIDILSKIDVIVPENNYNL